MNQAIIRVSHLHKTYAGGLCALRDIDLEIRPGEIFALLGPNGAGKTTLIHLICGIAKITSGSISVGGYDIAKDYRGSRSLIGLVPQELTTDAFETVWNTVAFTRGLFGKPANPDYIATVLKNLSLWDKKDRRLRTLSGGMKRRVMIAKALSHEPLILFLDEPTAGVDVELRKDMWRQVRNLRASGVTIILTTHYIEEAEEMADRVGVIHRGQLILVEEKETLMKKLGNKQMILEFRDPAPPIPQSLQNFALRPSTNGHWVYTYDSAKTDNGIPDLFEILRRENIVLRDVHTRQSSLEEIFVELVKN